MIMIVIILTVAIVSIALLVLGIKWDWMREFFHSRYAFFEVSFVIIYALEQILFVIMTVIYPEHRILFTSLFALIVILTIGVDKELMKSRNNKLIKLESSRERDYKRLFRRYVSTKRKLKNLEKRKGGKE